MIPRNIFQTHKSRQYILSKSNIKNAVTTWSKYANKYEYFFYDDLMCEEFMKNFDENIYSAYCKLPLAVMKADLWRYCIIYQFGGIYADADTICKAHPDIFITDSLTIVPENEVHLCQWIFSAPKNCPILKSVIDLSVERILGTEIKGEHIIHHLTGPGVFTDGIEKYLIQNGMPTFQDKKQYYKYPNDILKVFNYNFFHKNIVQHLFTGNDSDGWCKERDLLLC
jgi:mannosyltransferase OCH1-like enzyme